MGQVGGAGPGWLGLARPGRRPGRLGGGVGGQVADLARVGAGWLGQVGDLADWSAKSGYDRTQLENGVSARPPKRAVLGVLRKPPKTPKNTEKRSFSPS